jgi:hypothetical protein
MAEKPLPPRLTMISCCTGGRRSAIISGFSQERQVLFLLGHLVAQPQQLGRFCGAAGLV